MIDEHESCRKEMARIHDEWADYHSERCKVKAVLIEREDGKWAQVAQIVDVQYTEDGLVVRVR